MRTGCLLEKVPWSCVLLLVWYLGFLTFWIYTGSIGWLWSLLSMWRQWEKKVFSCDEVLILIPNVCIYIYIYIYINIFIYTQHFLNLNFFVNVIIMSYTFFSIWRDIDSFITSMFVLLLFVTCEVDFDTGEDVLQRKTSHAYENTL